MKCDYCDNKSKYAFVSGERICSDCLSTLPKDDVEGRIAVAAPRKELSKIKSERDSLLAQSNVPNVDSELLSSAIKGLEDLSKWRTFVFNGRELDTETWECTDCGYCSTVRAATNQETASYSFRLQLHLLGYQLGEIDCKRISYTNYKFLSEILKNSMTELKTITVSRILKS